MFLRYENICGLLGYARKSKWSEQIINCPLYEYGLGDGTFIKVAHVPSIQYCTLHEGSLVVEYYCVPLRAVEVEPAKPKKKPRPGIGRTLLAIAKARPCGKNGMYSTVRRIYCCLIAQLAF